MVNNLQFIERPIQVPKKNVFSWIINIVNPGRDINCPCLSSQKKIILTGTTSIPYQVLIDEFPTIKTDTRGESQKYYPYFEEQLLKIKSHQRNKSNIRIKRPYDAFFAASVYFFFLLGDWPDCPGFQMPPDFLESAQLLIPVWQIYILYPWKK